MLKFLQTSRRAPGRPAFALVFWWTFVRGLIWLVFKLLYRLRCYGFEHVPRTGPVIYVANHQSHYDPPIAGILVHDRPFAAMARASLFKFKLFAWMIRSIGAIDLEQGRGDAGAMKAALAELEAGRCVLIFPEGTRTRDGALGEFQRGVMLLIRRSCAPVMPIAIEGAFDVWPTTAARPKLSGRLGVMGAPPIPTDELLKDGADAAMERLKRQIESMRLQLRDEMRRTSRGRYPAPGPGDEPYWACSAQAQQHQQQQQQPIHQSPSAL